MKKFHGLCLRVVIKVKVHTLILLIAILISLSIDGMSMCINAEDITTEKITDLVYADSRKNKSACGAGWVKSQIPLTAVQGILNIKDKDVNLCTKGGGSNESQSVELTIGAIAPPATLSGLSFNQYDSVQFSALPYLSGEITTQICENSDPRIKVFDEQACKTQFVGKYYSAINSNNLTDYSSNIVNYYNVSASAWKSAPLYVIDTVDSSDNNTLGKSIQFLSKYYSSPYDLWRVVCGNTIFSNTDPRKVHVENIRTGMTSHDINRQCGNICYVEYHPDGTTKTLDSNCVFSVTTEKDAHDQYFSYLPALHGGEIGSAAFANVGTLRMSGIQLNKEYELSTSSPTIYYDIGAGNTGGYKVLASRKCTYHNKRSLYYYVGSSCPTFAPGDSRTTLLPMIESGDYVSRLIFKTDPAWNGKNIYFAVKDNGDGNDHHMGYFEIESRVLKELKAPFGHAVDWVVKQVNNSLYSDNPSNLGAVQRIYNQLTSGPFIVIAQGMLILYIAMYALLYIMGIVRGSQVEVLVLVFKVGAIAALISPTSWTFFNQYLFQLFKEGSLELINIMASHTDGDTGFKFIDRSLSRFAEIGTWIQIFSIIFTGPIGFIAAFAIVWGVWMLFLAILNAIVVFLISIIIIALLLSIAPLFIIFILFKRTKIFFDNWIKILTQTAIQPVMIFAMIAMLNRIMMGITYALFNFDICTQCVATVTISNKVKAFCLLNTYLPRNYVADSTYTELARETYDGFSLFGLPFQLPSLIAFIVLCHAVSKFVETVPSIVATIFNTFGVELDRPAAAVKDSAKKAMGRGEQYQQQKAHQSYMDKLRDNPLPNKDKREEARKEIKK